MSGSAEALMGAYATTDMLMPLVLDDLSEGDARKRARGEAGPSIAWTVGHLLHSRCWVLELLGREKENPWSEMFGTTPATDGAEYPTLAELRAAWSELSVEVAEALAGTTDEQFDARVEKGWHEDQVMRDQVVFFGWHEGYHLGVIGALRKALGYKGPAEKITEARAG